MRTITNSDEGDILNFFEKGCTLREIGELCGIDIATVSKILVKYGYHIINDDSYYHQIPPRPSKIQYCDEDPFEL